MIVIDYGCVLYYGVYDKKSNLWFCCYLCEVIDYLGLLCLIY